MAGRPSIVPEYITILLRTIERTQNDPARLRSLVYDVARLSLGKHVLMNYQQIGSAGLQQHVSDLEAAINHVEDVSQKQLEDFSKKGPSQDQQKTAAGSEAQFPGCPVSASDDTPITFLDSSDQTMFDGRPSNKNPLVAQPPASQLYVSPRTEILPPLEFRVPTFGTGLKGRQVGLRFGVQLVIATIGIGIGIGIYTASLVGFDYRGNAGQRQPGDVFNARFFPAAERADGPAAAAVPPNVPAKSTSAGAQALGFPLPTMYGVYAASEGKLYELDLLPLKVPDARVAISAIFSAASRVALPEGKVEFIIFRRDLVSSAPTEVFVRVVARVMREMKFNGARPPTTTNIDGEYVIRSKSYVFRVAPLADNPEMVVLRPAASQEGLSPGRYALVLAGKGYDFTIEGQATDAAQCLERTNVVGGIVYSECRNRPTQMAN
jgi:hypothetical protein